MCTANMAPPSLPLSLFRVCGVISRLWRLYGIVGRKELIVFLESKGRNGQQPRPRPAGRERERERGAGKGTTSEKRYRETEHKK